MQKSIAMVLSKTFFQKKQELYASAILPITIFTLSQSATVCSIVHSESKKSFWLKQDPNLGQLELPQVDAKTTEPLSYLRNLLVF